VKSSLIFKVKIKTFILLAIFQDEHLMDWTIHHVSEKIRLKYQMMH